MTRRPALSAFFLVLCGWSASAGLFSGELPRISPKFSGERREPPDRGADALHLKLEVEFDWEKREVAGKAHHTFRALEDGLRRIRLDAVKLHVLKVEGPSGEKLEFESRPETLKIDLGRERRRGEEIRFAIEYRCRPERGVYFRAPDDAYPRTPKQLWTQGESIEARHWIPCFDHPVDKLTTEVLVKAPEGLMALSNGRLAGEPAASAGGGRVFHWIQDKPHTTYLIAVVVGDFAEYRDEWNGIPIVSYVPRDRAEDAARSFSLTRAMMQFFSDKTGVPYPWAKYGQACVEEFLMGGMENTSLTILTDRTLHDAAAALDVESHGLVAHELAHQWFGDLATCKDWAEIWLNESFATFFENIYREHHLGWDEGVHGRMEQGEAYMAEDRNEYRRPLVSYQYRHPDDLFDAHAYPKGARILSMLRYVLGDGPFFAGVKRYLEERAYQPAETADLRQAMEEVSGASLRWFFDQWVHGGGHPVYKVGTEWDERSKVVRVRVEQTQKVDDLTALFRMPIEIEVVTPSGASLHRVEVARADETFTFPAAERPKMVRFDKRDWVLKELDFPRSREELHYQLREDGEISGRIEAARALAGRLDDDARKALLDRLAGEPFWGVRVEIVRALRQAGGPTVRDGLIGAFASEKRSHVRREIVSALGEYPGTVTAAFLRKALGADPSYFVAASALRSLSRLDRLATLPDVYRSLERDSHGEEIRLAAIECIARSEQLEGKAREEAVNRLLELHKRGQPRFVRSRAGAALARRGRGIERVYTALISAIDDPHPEIRRSTFRALADFGDRRAIEPLRERREKEGHRPFRNPLDDLDEAVKRLEGVGDKDQLLDEIRRLREAGEGLERRIKNLEEKGGEGKGPAREV